MSKITKSARGEECTLRLPGICNFNPETTILAHVGPSGMGGKSHDIHAIYCCSDCHDVIDGRVINNGIEESARKHLSEDIFRAMVETQLRLIDKGLIKI